MLRVVASTVSNDKQATTIEARRELASILADPTVQTIVVEHRDRLARFGVAQLECVMATRSSWWTLVSAMMTSCVT